jgi:hypothetical protein
VASKKIARHRDKQPEPHDEDEYRKDIHEEVSIGETLLKKQHRAPPSPRDPQSTNHAGRSKPSMSMSKLFRHHDRLDRSLAG